MHIMHACIFIKTHKKIKNLGIQVKLCHPSAMPTQTLDPTRIPPVDYFPNQIPFWILPKSPPNRQTSVRPTPRPQHAPLHALARTLTDFELGVPTSS